MSLLQDEVRQLVGQLREARIAAGLTQKDIAELVGCPLSKVSQFETHSLPHPPISLMLGYLKALGVEEGWLDRVLPQPAEDYLPPAPPVDQLLAQVAVMALQPDCYNLSDMLDWLVSQDEVASVHLDGDAAAAFLREGGRLVWRPDPGAWVHETAWAVASLGDDSPDGGAS